MSILERVQDLGVLNLKAGDLLVLKITDDATNEDMDAIHEFVSRHLQRHDIDAACIILPSSTEIGIVRAEDRGNLEIGTIREEDKPHGLSNQG